ncbi:MAG: hypothetical protein A3F82_03930 [Deltaproteobacteria bacterium RIFCSPLOWO2_12_FULL_44_12]|nr:MAG: hypothetical protein A2979_07230 [Deltaproteobacteria bacterium RIFCSPLOWO2_01_FULL_45_74]OGQ70680.1 MAG: hypothetical protein A3F82_03930 [Deltaproteobacteria bacterium RIFCSPLOWO2_12_FULL_44_12]
MKNNPLALYIHIPYCLEKCPYCDFHSIATQKKEIPEEEYASLLIAQLIHEVERLDLRDRSLISIFFGGGTPSLMSPKFFDAVINEVMGHFNSDADLEITVETNPATATFENFKQWQSLGINRVSFGAQSFNDILLKKLGRNHSSAQAKEAIQEALDAGFTNVSCDLIFGIEGQSFKDLENDLETTMSFEIPHISAYQLTVESGTPLASWVQSGKFHLPQEEVLAQMHHQVAAKFENHGWHRYEISNYAKKGFECRHNLQYWRYKDYLGIGSGAVSFMNGKRWRTTRKLSEYLKRDWFYEDEETINEKTAQKERWMMSLRLAEGVLMTKQEKEKWKPMLLQWEKEGWIIDLDNRMALTDKGFLFCSRITQNVFALIDEM